MQDIPGLAAPLDAKASYREITLDDHAPPVAVEPYISPEPTRLFVAFEARDAEPASGEADSIISSMGERIVREGFQKFNARKATIAEMRKPRTRVPTKALRAHVSARRPRTRERRQHSNRSTRRATARADDSDGSSEPALRRQPHAHREEVLSWAS